ncbi:MAG: FAD-dependent oxidoreductase, partial [Cyclobacteriaceae bacterium]|nr:FAD-dependent oxidoreductase [Cyclobacteriaceae bacterium]
MKKLKITLPPEVALDPLLMQSAAARKAGFGELDRVAVRVKRRSIDARGKQIRVHLELELYPSGEIPPAPEFSLYLDPVDKKDPVILVGAGPAGLFAALKLIELGLKPVVVERGKDVRSRRRDIAAINRQHMVDPDSNYCFGEGGAGTYSDGKLYTRSKKRGDVQRVLQILASHGAPEDILVDNHPHIGTNKLPKVVKALRETILQAGGEIHFQSRVEDLIRQDDRIIGVKDQNGQRYEGKAVILATGHSARDIFSLLHGKDLQLQLKPFAIGVRVEHPQVLIDSIQYRRTTRGLLPAASYQLSHQLEDNRGVFSFCMCPGGFIVPSATSPGELVVNGMSPSRRDSQFANSGI